jgi:hypothetical protein
MSVGCLLRSLFHEQGSSDDIGEREERLGPGGVREQVPETPVVESSVASAADVMSAAAGAGATAASEADKTGTSAPPATGGEGSDRGTSDSREAPPSRGIIDEGMEVVKRRRPVPLHQHPVGGRSRY